MRCCSEKHEKSSQAALLVLSGLRVGKMLRFEWNPRCSLVFRVPPISYFSVKHRF